MVEGGGMRVLKSYPYQEWRGKGKVRENAGKHTARPKNPREERTQPVFMQYNYSLSNLYFSNRDYPNLAAEKKIRTY